MPRPAAPKSLQIFKPGRHTSMAGQALEFGESHLQATAQAYDPSLHQAPLVVGHPQHDKPAYGWVGALSFADGALEAVPADVDPAFAEMVDRKAFKFISAAFYAPDAPGNPVPGVYYLRHVGFLGAVPPAVKGLRSPSFSSGEDGVVEFSEWDDATNASLWRNLREWLIGKFGREEADVVIPSFHVGDLERGAQDEIREAAVARASNAPASQPAFADPLEPSVTPEQAAALQAENDRLAAELAASRAAQAEAARAARLSGVTADATAFTESLVAQGRLPVGHAPVVVATLVALAGIDAAAPVEFGEGADRAPVEPALRQLLQALPPGVEFSEVATATQAAAQGGQAVAFAEASGAVVDPASQALHLKVVAYQASHGTDYVAALQAVQAGRS